MGSFKTYDEEAGEFSQYPYVTVKKTENVKIVVSTGLYKNAKPIELAHSASSVYAVKDYDGTIKNINVFDENKKKVCQIDLDHYHNKMKPHVHVFGKNDKYHSNDVREPSQYELHLIKIAKEATK